MSSIVKRGTSYQVFIAKQGVRKTATFRTKAAAVAWANEIEHSIESGQHQLIPNITFGDLLDRYAKEVSPAKGGFRWEVIRIEAVKRTDLGKVSLSDFNAAHVYAWKMQRLKVVKSATVARDWNLLSNACSIAMKEWKWLKENPFGDVKRPKDSDPRDRRISEDEIEAIRICSGYDALAKPETATQIVCAAFLFAIETAMRSQEIIGLTWDRVHLDQRYLQIAKSKTFSGKREVPLSQAAILLIEQMKGVDKTKVFPLSTDQRDALFRKIRDRSNIKGLTFHDTRHEAITRLAGKMHILDLARTIGHKDLKKLMVYYNKSAADIAKDLHKEMT